MNHELPPSFKSFVSLLLFSVIYVPHDLINGVVKLLGICQLPGNISVLTSKTNWSFIYTLISYTHTIPIWSASKYECLCG